MRILEKAKSSRFWLVRDVDHTGISGTGTVADGIVFPDGTCVMRWREAHKTHGTRGVKPTTVVHESVESVIALHGHGGATRIEWLDEEVKGVVYESDLVALYRDAVSGEYVTKEYAEANPETTVSETAKVLPA